jgi:hypothetical protein
MRLTDKLLGYLNRVWNKDPERFLAFRISRAGGAMTWVIADAQMTLSVAGSVVAVINLSNYTLAGLVTVIAGLGGVSVTQLDGSRAKLSARVLMDGTGDTGQSDGGRIFGYTSLLWSYIEAVADELGQAETQIENLPNQMQVTTASGSWLDEIGSYYNVGRNVGESDTIYGARIIAEAVRPRGNGIALENAIMATTGLISDVPDVSSYGALFPLYDGVINYDGSQVHNAAPQAVYCLFDTFFAFNMVGPGDLTAMVAAVRAIIKKSRDAGMHLRTLGIYLNTPDGILTTEDGTPIVWPV